MPEMIAKVAQEYGGRWRSEGEVFHVEPRHVRLLSAMGRVAMVDGSEYQTRHIQSAPKKKRNRMSLLGTARKVA